MNLTRFQRWRALHGQLQALWGKAVGTPGYTRQEWQDFEAEIERLAREGVGEPDVGSGDDDDTTIPGRKPS